MKQRIFNYENEEIKVSWDQKRCIHAEACVHGLPNVFDPDDRPWIQPDEATTSELVKVIEQCPTGALHYSLKNENREEQPPSINTIEIEENGPVYIHGEVVIRNMDEEVILKDTRVALCRCGASRNKPLCDNSHIKAEFKADSRYNPERLQSEETEGEGGELSVKLFDNAPFLVQGNYTLKSGATGSTQSGKKMSFCRCGHSQTKPFCDGSHKAAGFES